MVGGKKKGPSNYTFNTVEMNGQVSGLEVGLELELE